METFPEASTGTLETQNTVNVETLMWFGLCFAVRGFWVFFCLGGVFLFWFVWGFFVGFFGGFLLLFLFGFFFVLVWVFYLGCLVVFVLVWSGFFFFFL